MKNVFMIAVLLFSMAMTAEVKLPEIREVLKHVETGCNPDVIGDNGASFGILQIKQIAIDDVNRIYGTNYIHQDAFDISCADEIFDLYVTIWSNKLEQREGRQATIEDVVRIWNGGPRGYLRNSTTNYYNKFIKNQYLCHMEGKEPSRKCLVGGKLGLITKSYTHTQDVFIFKTRTTMHGVHKRYVKLLPMAIPTPNDYQYKIQFA